MPQSSAWRRRRQPGGSAVGDAATPERAQAHGVRLFTLRHRGAPKKKGPGTPEPERPCLRAGTTTEEIRVTRTRAGSGGAAAPRRRRHLGMTTLSITWITPLLAVMSVLMTLAASTVTPPLVPMVSSLPCTVLTLPALTSAAMTLPGTTW